MTGGFTDADNAIVARYAIVDDTGMLEGRQGKIRRDVTGRAIQDRRQVGDELADADDVVVARGTITDDAGVIEDATGECAGCVADIAIFNCWHMVACLAECISPIVAGIAANRGHHVSRVVDKCADKAHRVMARTAVRGGDWMTDRLAGCRSAVVAGGAGLCDRIEKRVIENTAHVECADVMTRHAVHAGHGMVLCLPGRVNTVVTAGTVARDVTVVDIRWQECVRRVTEAALTFSDEVPCILARGCRSIVTSGAGADIVAMVEAAARQAIEEVIGIVAFIACLGRRHMKL